MGKNTLNIASDFLTSIADIYHDSENDDCEAQKSESTPWRNRKPFSKRRMRGHIKQLLEVSLWGSLMPEEKRQHRFAVVYAPHEDLRDHVVFAKPLDFDAEHLAKLAPALESTGAIAVWANEQDKNKLEIWGFAHLLLGGAGEILVKAIAPAQLLLCLQKYDLKARITAIKAEW